MSVMPQAMPPRRPVRREPQSLPALWGPVSLAVGLLTLSFAAAGCSLGVMAGKMIFGDPTVPASFRMATRVDLTKANKRVLVICTAPDLLLGRHESIEYDVIKRVTSHLEKEGIPVVNSNDVSDWMDRNHDVFRHPSQLVSEFDADYVVHIELRQYTQHEENSATLYRGKLSGAVSVYEVVQEGGQKRAWQVYGSEFTTTYPEHAPLPQHQVASEDVFVRACVDHASLQLAQLFYDHPPREEVH